MRDPAVRHRATAPEIEAGARGGADWRALGAAQCTLGVALPPTAPTKAHPAGEAQYLTRTIMQPINHTAAGARGRRRTATRD